MKRDKRSNTGRSRENEVEDREDEDNAVEKGERRKKVQEIDLVFFTRKMRMTREAKTRGCGRKERKRV